ncbi:MAG: hypothetical protein ACREFO_00605 [Acetobacteraceae bacterium]
MSSLACCLLVSAAAAWALLVSQAGSASAEMAMALPTMGMQAPRFLAIWIVMMVAMMFSTAAPLHLHGEQRHGHVIRV